MNLFEKTCKENSKTEKKNITIELCIFELDSTNNVGLLKQIYHKKDTSFSKQKEWTWSLYFHISVRPNLSTKFQLKLVIKSHFQQTILKFWTKFAQKGYSPSKTEKVNIAIEFCIFKLAYTPNVKLKLKILIFWTKFTQRGYLLPKSEKVNITT